MKQPREPLRPGARIKTCDKLLPSRKSYGERDESTFGCITHAIIGSGNALYEVIHDDGSPAVYLIDELELVVTPSVTVQPLVEQGKMSTTLEVKEPWSAMKKLL